MKPGCGAKGRWAVVAALTIGLATASHATEAPELEARVAELERLVRALQADARRDRCACSPEPQTTAQTPAVQAAVNRPRATPPNVADATATPSPVVLPAARGGGNTSAAPTTPLTSSVERDGFLLGNTRVKVGGYVDLDAHVTVLSDGDLPANSIARDFYIPGATPTDGEQTETTDFTAESTRFFIDAKQEKTEVPLRGYIELDFLSSLQGNQRVSNSFSPRLRRAFFEVNGKWLIGQEWSTFQNVSAIPESASFLVLGDGMVFDRQPLIRFTHGAWQFALENPDATITPAEGGRLEADGNAVPDGVVRWNRKGDFGNFSVAAVARQLRIDQDGMSDDTFGWGGSASGRIRVGSRGDDLRFNLVAGDGVGRYVGLNAVNGVAMNPTTGDLETIMVAGGLLAWRHPIGRRTRFNIGISGLFADTPDFVTGNAIDETRSAYTAVLWNATPRLSFGAEINYGEIELVDGSDGSIARFTFSTKMDF